MLQAYDAKNKPLLNILLNPTYDTLLPFEEIMEEGDWRIMRYRNTGFAAHRYPSYVTFGYRDMPAIGELKPCFSFVVGGDQDLQKLVKQVFPFALDVLNTTTLRFDLYTIWQHRQALENLVRKLADASPVHYHVLVSLHGGYMPSTNEVYLSRDDAVDAARAIVDRENEARAMDAHDDIRPFEEVEDDPNETYWDLGNEYIEVVECNDRCDCEIED